MRRVMIALLLVASVAQAESWQKIAEIEAKGSVMFLDTESMTRAGQRRTARLKLVYDSDQPVPDGYRGKPPDVSTYRWDTNDYIFDCAKRTVAHSQSILYSVDNQVVGRLDIPKRAWTFREALPGTAAGRIVNTICHWGEVNPGNSVPAQVTNAANPADYFPPGTQKAGSAIIQACVGADGQLLRDPIVVGSSGSPDLDGAAIKVAKATRYSAGTENGRRLSESCIKFRVMFVLKD